MAKILWIDDYAGKGNHKTKQRMGFDALVFFLEERGHYVQIVTNPDAIEVAIDEIDSYAAIILDIIMQPLPSSSHANQQYGGMDVLERLSRSRLKIPIIVFSVVQKRKIREEARLRGLDLNKIGVKYIKRKGDLTPTQLANLIERLLPKTSS